MEIQLSNEQKRVLYKMFKRRVLIDAGYDKRVFFLGWYGTEAVPEDVVMPLLRAGLITMDTKTIPGPPLRFLLTDSGREAVSVK